VVFGDSISDNGNVQKTLGFIPGDTLKWEGRFSNGPVWVEYLAENSNAVLENYAFGSAQTGYQANIPGIPGLLKQIEIYLNTSPVFKTDTLYVVQAGANDFIGGSTDYITSVSNIIQGVNTLIQSGAKNILVVNMPDLGKTPAVNQTANSPMASMLSYAFNQTLSYQISYLQSVSSSKIVLADLYGFTGSMIQNPGAYNIINLTDVCPNIFTADDFDGMHYLFWDYYHPTTDVHDRFADYAEKLIDVSF
jgi:phospholipase/lecithinase/hemolysin